MSAAGVRGPLSSTFSQWSVLGLGALGLYGNDDFCSSILRGIQKVLLGDGGKYLMQSFGNTSNHNPTPQLPIVIQNGNASGKSNGVWLVVQLGFGTLVCWGSFVLMGQLLPDAFKNVLPVTKKVFDVAVVNLGKAVVNVRDALQEQILGVERKQDELVNKVDDTHDEILHVKDSVNDLGDMVYRCERTLNEGERRQLYTAKGVRLVLRCISSILPASSKFNSDLDQYYRQGNDLGLNEDSQYSNNNSAEYIASPSVMATPNGKNNVTPTATAVEAIPLAHVSPCTATPPVKSTSTPSQQKQQQPNLDDLQRMMQMMRNMTVQT